MTETQRFLLDGGTLSQLTEKYAIKVRRSEVNPSLVLLKYDQIHSPMGERIVQECRGLILDESDNWSVVSRSFDKFFNHGEGHAAQIDWSTARVQEKLDGSLCTLYHYADRWHVATTGHPDAAGDVNGMSMTFADLFWRTFRGGLDAPGYILPLPRDPDLCFMFELTSPYNRIVVRHREPSLTLLAVRRRTTGGWLDADEFSDRYPTVNEWPLTSIEECVASFGHIDPLNQEGYVVLDAQWNRIKVKHPGYVAIHHLKDGICPRRILEIVRAGETTELLTHFPEWEPEFREIETAYNRLVAELERDYERIRGIEIQKDFAREALKTRCSGALFNLRSGKTPTIRHFLADMRIQNLMDTLGLRDAEPMQEAA